MSAGETTMRFHPTLNLYVSNLSNAKVIYKHWTDRYFTPVRFDTEEDLPEYMRRPHYRGYSWEGSAVTLVKYKLNELEGFFIRRDVEPSKRLVLPFDPHKQLSIIKDERQHIYPTSWAWLREVGSIWGRVTAFKPSYRARGFFGPQDWIWEKVIDFDGIELDEALRNIFNNNHPWRFIETWRLKEGDK